jgi:hypothetical protein
MRAMLAGAASSCVGILVAASGSGTAGGILVVLGWAVFVYGIHRFGRAGA